MIAARAGSMKICPTDFAVIGSGQSQALLEEDAVECIYSVFWVATFSLAHQAEHF